MGWFLCSKGTNLFVLVIYQNMLKNNYHKKKDFVSQVQNYTEISEIKKSKGG